MISCFILLLYAYAISGIGYDAGGADRASCGRPYRAGRLYQPPCDLGEDGYCINAGQLYPWKAVKKFVKDNQGLMRRMYGDQSHGNVLQAELDQLELDRQWKPTPVRYAKYQREPNDNALDDEDFELDYDDEPRYRSNDDVLNTKFVISEQEPIIAIKLAELKTAHFRPVRTTIKPPKEVTSKNVTKLIPENATIESTTEKIQEPTTTNSPATSSTTTTEDATTDTTTEVRKTSTATNDRLGEYDNDYFISVSGNNNKLDQSGEGSETVFVESELKKTTTEKTMLFQDMVDDPMKHKAPINFNNMKGINACPVKEEVVAPFWANNTRGEVLALLNMYPFEQYVHWEKCTFEHRQMYCRDGCRCEQQYRLHRLLAYDPNNECRGIFSDWFRFPSCCICKCYDLPPEFRVTSRSPRFQMSFSNAENDKDS